MRPYIPDFMGEDWPVVDPDLEINAGLVEWWPCFERGGITVHGIKQGINGTMTGMDPATDWVRNRDGYALDFITNDYVTIPNSPDLNFGHTTYDDPLTVSAWFMMRDATNFRAILKDAFAQYMLGTGAEVLYWSFSDWSQASLKYQQRWTAALTGYQGQLIHACGTYDGRGGANAYLGMHVYVNGQLADASFFAGANYVAMEPGAGALEFGRYSTQYMDGQLSNVRIWRRGLNASEVAELAWHPWSGLWVPSGRTTIIVPAAPSGFAGKFLGLQSPAEVLGLPSPKEVLGVA